MDELVLIGILLSEKGIGPTEGRVKAIVEARQPTTQAEVRGFMGLANFSARIIPNFATIAEPLREITRKNFKFEFGQKQVKAFEKLKLRMTDAKTLAYFDKNAHTQVQWESELS